MFRANILPIIRSVRLRYLQHMVSRKDGYTESYVVSSTSLYNINNYYDISHTKLHNFLYIHLCRIPHAVNISVSRS